MNTVDQEKEFIELICQNERLIYKVCSFYASDDLPLADLYQESVINLWTGYPKFRGESSVSTWIYRVVLNTCISGLRKEKRTPKGISVAGLNEVLPDLKDMTEEINEMYRLINRLKTVEKAIVLLWLEEKTYQEIADIMGLTVCNVATKLKRSKIKLKEMSNR
ncbi:sigma-70 family RNA polymerase sigma factor [Dysgonomonas massiliensis]|uniref:sigma-70 family RNA polymerase sigma factor n=1 Tax=Dysgonomonas massiliensis TaxID=2040292 RepID=UPI000C7764D7|nr:sigma-70 family RNA polymerase sigma factor [Dysgonomonas massiliensis]